MVWFALCAMVNGMLPGMAALAAEKQAVSLEQAIQAVKAAFEVPGEFSVFSSGYNQYGEQQTWSLNWRTAKEPGGSMYAEVDAQTGDIINVNIWQYRSEPEPRAKLPAISRDEAVKIAQDLLGRLQPGRLAELNLQTGSHELLPLMSWGPATYNIQWQRQVDGVPFPQDGVTIAVSTESSQITSYNFRWTRGELPYTDKVISPEQARVAFNHAKMLSLQYFRPSPRERGQQAPVMLIYRLDHPSNGAIDALTGEPVVDLDGRIIDGQGGMADQRMKEVSNSAAVPLTPQEVAEIDQAANIISQQDAEAVVRQWVTIAGEMQLRSVNLYSNDWENPGDRTWNFHWNTERNTEKQEIDQGYSYLSAQVNAVSGELLGFSRDQPWLASSGSGIQRITREEAQKLAESFLHRIQPERFQQVKLLDDRLPHGPITFKEEMPNQAFNYQRLVNGITYPANGLSVNVDTSTGDILSYNLNWSELDFPSPDGVLQLAAAEDRFLAGQPLSLHYTSINRSGEQQQEIKLIYRPLTQPGTLASNLIDARTGEALDWQGKPVTLQPQPYRFTDINGHWAEKEISLLGQAGIFGEYGDSFQPGSDVTNVQFLRAMLMLNDSVEGAASLTDEEVIERARQYGWVKEDLNPTDGFNRQILAQLTVRFLGLERAARVQGIYMVPFTDLKEIASDTLGYVALSWGLGVLKGDAGKFRPTDSVSRAEAAVALVRALPVER